jgi:hypothetical protein
MPIIIPTIIIEIIVLSGIVVGIKIVSDKTKKIKRENNMKIKVNKVEESKIVEETEPKTENQDNIVDMKELLELENKSRKLVDIKKITLDNNPDISTMYLLKVAGIDIRLFIDLSEATKDGRFMQHVVRHVIKLGSAAKAEVKEVTTGQDIYYLLKIANKNVKIYTGKEEAGRVASYMTNVINAILKNS